MSGNRIIFTHCAHIISSRLKTQAVRAASLLLIPVFLYACRDSADTSRVRQVGRAMGTYFEITIYHPDEEAARAGARAAFAEISRIERLTSNYRADSELTELNRSAARQPYAASDELFEIIREALVYSRMSDGAFDVTVGPLLKLWGFTKKSAALPTDRELDRTLDSIGSEKVLLDEARKSVRFARPGMEIDLGGIGKGYAVDRALDVLKRHGIKSALINAGSSTIFALGSPPGKEAWEIGIEDPMDRQRLIAVVKLKNNSLSSSGDYQKFFTLNGTRYSHIIDPRTGRPAQGVYLASVIAPGAAQSDALSTAVFVLGPEKGLALLDSLNNVCGLIVAAGEGTQRYRKFKSKGSCDSMRFIASN